MSSEFLTVGSKIDPTMLQICFKYAIEKGLGVIPDPREPWFSPAAIAAFLGRQTSTIENDLSGLKKLGLAVPQHPLGAFYQLSAFISANSAGKSREKKTAKKGKR